MAETTHSLRPGTLWATLTARTEQALRSGALQSLPTEYDFIEQQGVRFLVRILTSLARKDAAKRAQSQTTAAGTAFDPFMPYEEDLFVADLSATHLVLLNKFNVLDHHLLIVTRAFESQDTPLTLSDFAALWQCMREFEGLAFYNGGRVAGASQDHKHLQMVPLPLVPAGPRIPIEPLLTGARFQCDTGVVPTLPFVHALMRLNAEAQRLPAPTLAWYRAMLQRFDLNAPDERIRPYNLLATRDWLLLVPRSQECFESISINALGFAGALLVRSHEQKRRLQEVAPLTVLRTVAVAAGN